MVKLPFKLWVSYKRKKFVLIGQFEFLHQATAELNQYYLNHTISGDRLKLTASKEAPRG